MIIIGTFTLTQIQAGKNFYIYPNRDLSGCTEFTAVGDNPNYTCVDEDRLVPDEDATYVWWNGVAAALDLYEMQNHTSEIGTINYVQVYARVKSHEIAQHADGIYKIICSPDSTCSHIYKSDDINLTTSYTTYNKVWVNNPGDDDAWEWADIDVLCCGAECNSPIITGAAHSLTLRPNAVGDLTQWNPIGAANNWQCVDEAVPDYYTTYVRTLTASRTDLYNLNNHTTETGTILHITIYAWARVSYGLEQIKLAAKSGGVTVTSDAKNVGTTWTLFSHQLATDPSTGVAWTWNGIDNLQAGIKSGGASPSAWIDCTQVYIIVEYTENINPEIRTTQCYAKVNYDAELICTLNKPQQVNTNHARNIKMLNFWDGEREVYDLNRSGKSMVLTGTESYNGSCDRILCLRNMARNGRTITISGLSLGYFNGDYKINQVGWKKISEKPEHYKWILELEDVEL